MAPESPPFTLFTPLFREFDGVVCGFANTVSSRVMVAITPVIEAALFLWVVWWGIRIMNGFGHASVAMFFGKYIRNAAIVGFALSVGFYQDKIAGTIITLPDDLAAAVMGDAVHGLYNLSNEPMSIGPNVSSDLGYCGGASVQGALIDRAAGQGIIAASDIFKQAGFFQENGIVFGVYGGLLLLATIAIVGLGGAIIITAKLVLGILVGLGPLFIAALLFDATKHFFERWVAMLVTYGLVIVLFGALFTFMLGIYGHYVRDVRLDGSMNAAYSVAGALILSLVSILVLREVKPLAMGLGGGVMLPRLANWMRGDTRHWEPPRRQAPPPAAAGQSPEAPPRGGGK